MANKLLSKVLINGIMYDVKDAVARQTIVDEISKLKAAAYKDVAADMSSSGLVDAAVVKAYVDSQISAINTFSYEIVSTLPTPSADTMFKIYLVPNSKVSPDSYSEWITLKNADDTYVFERFGDTSVKLDDYVPNTRTIAGLALSADISADQLKAKLGLGSLAYKDSASVVLDDYVKSVNSVDYTPSGSISGNVTAKGSINVELGHSDESAQITKRDYTPEGTVNVTLDGASFNAITSVGSQASFTEGKYTPAALTHTESPFATSGVTTSVVNGVLIFTSANTANASLISNFSGGSKAADTFVANTLPTMSQQTVSVKSAKFVGSKVSGAIVDEVSYKKAAISKADFTGETSEISATFTGTTATIAPSIVKGEKEITVS